MRSSSKRVDGTERVAPAIAPLRVSAEGPSAVPGFIERTVAVARESTLATVRIAGGLHRSEHAHGSWTVILGLVLDLADELDVALDHLMERLNGPHAEQELRIRLVHAVNVGRGRLLAFDEALADLALEAPVTATPGVSMDLAEVRADLRTVERAFLRALDADGELSIRPRPGAGRSGALDRPSVAPRLPSAFHGVLANALASMSED